MKKTVTGKKNLNRISLPRRINKKVLNSMSPLPWSRGYDGSVYDADGVMVAEFDHDKRDIDEREANKEIVIALVN